MRNCLQQLAFRYMRFMQGRNGMDNYNRFLLMTAVVISICGYLFRLPFLVLLCDVLLLYTLYRSFSKNLVKRSLENTSYMTIANWIRHLFIAAKKNLKDKEYKYFVCPQCHQIVRVPRGHGKIEMHCPHCGKTFEGRS